MWRRDADVTAPFASCGFVSLSRVSELGEQLVGAAVGLSLSLCSSIASEQKKTWENS